jgi:hypothetical protein
LKYPRHTNCKQKKSQWPSKLPFEFGNVQSIALPEHGLSLTYLFVGKDSAKPPLVLLSHFRSTFKHWDPLVLEKLSQNRKLILVNLPERGNSTGAVPTSYPWDAPLEIVNMIASAETDEEIRVSLQDVFYPRTDEGCAAAAASW